VRSFWSGGSGARLFACARPARERRCYRKRTTGPRKSTRYTHIYASYTHVLCMYLRDYRHHHHHHYFHRRRHVLFISQKYKNLLSATAAEAFMGPSQLGSGTSWLMAFSSCVLYRYIRYGCYIHTRLPTHIHTHTHEAHVWTARALKAIYDYRLYVMYTYI